MDILLFGVPNAGKSTIGAIIAEKLDYAFYDLDAEMKSTLHMTMEQFQNAYWLGDSMDRKKGEILGNILSVPGDIVVAVSAMYYSRHFTRCFRQGSTLPVELRDTPENIFNRLIFTDENDIPYADSMEYRNAHKAYYLKEIKKDITYYKKSFAHIPYQFDINNDPPETAADRFIEMFHLQKRR